MLSGGIDKDHVQKIFEHVLFVIFNYDRCIEYFLTQALRLKYGLSEAAAQEIMGTLKIYHPYGAVGSLPTATPLGQVVPFGSYKQHPASLINISEGIKTYTEEIQDSDDIRQLRSSISAADAIVFLGFAFHPQNMNLLQLDVPTSAKRIFGTALGFSLPDRNTIISQIHATIMPQPQQFSLDPSPCAVFFDDYQRTLALG
jgi:hypothetical protein